MVDSDSIERFNSKWKQDPSGCWIWTASKATNGYGQIKRPKQRRQIPAHRLSYLIHKGEIPEDAVICHTCDVRACVNPEHLFLGSKKDNSLDMVGKGRHLYGERAPSVKLTEVDVLVILDRIRKGEKQAALAREYGVGPMEISRIKTGKRWGHLNPEPMPALDTHKRLTPETLGRIRAMIAIGLENKKIAKAFDLHEHTISRIRSGYRDRRTS